MITATQRLRGMGSVILQQRFKYNAHWRQKISLVTSHNGLLCGKVSLQFHTKNRRSDISWVVRPPPSLLLDIWMYWLFSADFVKQLMSERFLKISGQLPLIHPRKSVRSVIICEGSRLECLSATSNMRSPMPKMPHPLLVHCRSFALHKGTLF